MGILDKHIEYTNKPYGNCPVLAHGHFLGYYFYFRARWNRATIQFASTEGSWELGNIIYRRVLTTTDGACEAGWLAKDTCEQLIHKGCVWFLLSLPLLWLKKTVMDNKCGLQIGSTFVYKGDHCEVLEFGNYSFGQGFQFRRNNTSVNNFMTFDFYKTTNSFKSRNQRTCKHQYKEQ